MNLTYIYIALGLLILTQAIQNVVLWLYWLEIKNIRKAG